MSEIAKNPLVSIWMIAYNHEEFIEQAIESVLFQKTDFAFELVIGEDNSTDKTAEIIKNYQIRYPHLIKVIFNKPNVGVMQNMIQTMERCKGEYIAMLEGDDYWTNPLKLQKQINFLRINKKISFCFHNATVKYENGKVETHKFAELEEREYHGKEIIKEWIVPTASVVFRNSELKFPDFAINCVHGDILLFLLILEKGPAYAFAEEWSVYRKNEHGVTISNHLNSSYINKVLCQTKKMNILFDGKYSDEFRTQRQYWSLALLKSLWVNSKVSRFIIEFVNFNVDFPFYFIKKYWLKLK
jgi:glycosyltransferase involved in cell wall biosynthesis